ncbi:MAG: hypothetical protein L6300_03650 [Syntrophaceae bacterium]|nr:hypothetical protein [Syntrophaceae bacterium]
MSCKHLLHYCRGTHIWSVASCSAKKTPYVPSLRELESYCQSGRHTVCPAYLFSYEMGCVAPEGAAGPGIVAMPQNQRKSA